MKVIFYIILFVYVARVGLVDTSAQVIRDQPTIFHELDTLIQRIYERSIPEENARLHFPQLLTRACRVNNEILRKIGKDTTYIFPLNGYSWKAIGGKGKGYLGANSYNFFDGNAHKGHPAHDIFVYDHNRDSWDDRTRKRVQVLALMSGIVASVRTGWNASQKDAKGQPIRSGNCVWLLSGNEKLLTYYAHLDTVMVEPGQIVRVGEILGYVGRTGMNAAKTRSTTHLHLMCLTFTNDVLLPTNLYHLLMQAMVNSSDEGR